MKQHAVSTWVNDEKKNDSDVAAPIALHVPKRRVALHKGTSDDRKIQALDIVLKTLRVLHGNLV